MTVRLTELMAPPFYAVHGDLKAKGHREYWLKGGRGSAKSSFVSLEILLGMMSAPEANAVVYRKVASTLRESVYEQMVWAVDRLGLSGEYRCRLAPLEIENLRTGQKILFRGADDPGKSKSIKLSKGYFGFLWFEELDEFAGMRDVRTIKASVLRGGDGVTFYTYNPPVSRRNWVNAEALIPRKDRLVHESRYLDLPPSWLGEAFLAEAEMLRRTNERAWRHMYLGEVTGTGGQVFDNLCLRPLTEGERNVGRSLCGLDFGFAVDPDAFIRVGYHPAQKKVWVLDEFYGVRVPTERLAREVETRSDGGVIRCDSADPRMIDRLRRLNLPAVGVKKGAGSVAAGLRWLQERTEIAIDPARCPRAAREFSAYEYPIGPDGEFLPEFPDKNNHLIDAMRYALEPVIRQRSARTLRGLY